jgi:hypothetical protein
MAKRVEPDNRDPYIPATNTNDQRKYYDNKRDQQFPKEEKRNQQHPKEEKRNSRNFFK